MHGEYVQMLTVQLTYACFRMCMHAFAYAPEALDPYVRELMQACMHACIHSPRQLGSQPASHAPIYPYAVYAYMNACQSANKRTNKQTYIYVQAYHVHAHVITLH